MKVLYAIQGTGNGHLARALELAPYLEEELEIDYLISGRSAELNFPREFKYRYHGAYFIFGRKGGIDYGRTFKIIRPFTLMRDIYKCPVREYDAVLNDFEPISAWAAKLKRVKCIGISHQASFSSPNVPRPDLRSAFFEFAMKNFAPNSQAMGFHYKAYDESISLPLIREEIKNGIAVSGDHNLVYLPAYGDEFLIEQLNRLKGERWKVFSKKAEVSYVNGNVEVYPVNRRVYSEALLTAQAVLIGAGFQGTSEALYLKKKMLVVPMVDQYEQLCNAAALDKLGVTIVDRIEEDFTDRLERFLADPNACSYSFEADSRLAAQRIIDALKP